MRAQENISQKSRNIGQDPTRDYTNSVENLRKKVNDARSGSGKSRNLKVTSTNDSKRR